MARRKEEWSCAVCGNENRPDKPGPVKFCSDSCREARDGELRIASNKVKATRITATRAERKIASIIDFARAKVDPAVVRSEAKTNNRAAWDQRVLNFVGQEIRTWRLQSNLSLDEFVRCLPNAGQKNKFSAIERGIANLRLVDYLRIVEFLEEDIAQSDHPAILLYKRIFSDKT